MSRREFSAKVKIAAFRRAAGHCERCTTRLYATKFRYNHRIPDQLGGEPTLENCEILCLACDTPQTYEKDIPAIAKAKRRERKHAGIRKPKGRPMPGTRASGIRRRFDGTVEKFR